MNPSKPEDYPLMWVWQYPNDTRIKRRVTYIYKNGCCDALNEDNDGSNYCHHCKEIKEPEYMTREQAVCFMAQNPTYIVRIEGGDWDHYSVFVFTSLVDRYEWTTTTGYKYGEPREFTTDYLEVSDDD